MPGPWGDPGILEAKSDIRKIVEIIEATAAREKIPLLQGGMQAAQLSRMPDIANISSPVYLAMAEVVRYLHAVAASTDRPL